MPINEHRDMHRDMIESLRAEIERLTRERDLLAREVADWRSRPDALRADKAEARAEAAERERDELRRQNDSLCHSVINARAQVNDLAYRTKNQRASLRANLHRNSNPDGECDTMTDETPMRERIARALDREAFAAPDGMPVHYETRKKIALRKADAVLDEIRKPTNGMLEATCKSATLQLTATGIYTAMIDAAKEGK